MGYFNALQFARIFSTAVDQQFHSLMPDLVLSNNYTLNTTKTTINRTDMWIWATDTCKHKTWLLNVKQTPVKTDIINEDQNILDMALKHSLVVNFYDLVDETVGVTAG